jgi:hypothetical protein
VIVQDCFTSQKAERLIVVGDGAVSDGTSGLGPRFGQDDAVALLVRVGGEQVHAEDDLGELKVGGQDDQHSFAQSRGGRGGLTTSKTP